MTTVPTFLIAGAARSGTNGLVQGLRTHPRVFVTEPKEPHYFALHGLPADFRGPGDAATINRVAVTERAPYLDLYPARHDYLALGDGSVSTLYYADRAVEEIDRVNPEMKVVVILRDPVERAFSSYSYMRARGFEPHEDFLQAVEDEPVRRAQNWHHIWHYTGMSRYADGLRTLRDGLGPDRVGVWFYDDMERDYETVIAGVLRFLELPRHAGEAEGVDRVNMSGAPRFPVLHRAIWWATGHEVLRSSVKQVTSYHFREAVRRRILRRSGMPDGARQELEPMFRDDLHELAALTEDVPGRPVWLTRVTETR